MGRVWSNTCLNFCVPTDGRNRRCAKWLWAPVSGGSHSTFYVFCAAYPIFILKKKDPNWSQTSYIDFRCFCCNISDTMFHFKNSFMFVILNCVPPRCSLKVFDFRCCSSYGSCTNNWHCIKRLFYFSCVYKWALVSLSR